MVSYKEAKEEIRLAAESDLETFIKLVAPHRVLGNIHRELIGWWTREDRKTHQLVLLPRDHGKSAMVGYRVAWEIVKRPDVRILYISSTSNLAEKQLKFIKDILTSDTVREYWPDLINRDEGKREKWTNSEICVDHPLRKTEGVRDPTVFTGGLTTSLTGLHCDIAVKDDVVVMENAYTEDSRRKVSSQCSLLSSIAGTDGEVWIVGTRYHPKDYYNECLNMLEDKFDKEGNIIDREPLYEKFEKSVESRGDGTGEFLWPRQRRSDGRWFGFDREILAKKRAQYVGNMMQYRAQYYNDPNDPDNQVITRDRFQYYEPQYLSRNNGAWFYKNKRLNVYAAVDFAYSLKKKSDYTAIVVIGVDSEGSVYVLDIDRFKTEKISDYYKHILSLHVKWDFRKIRAETTVAQKAIVRELKDNYIRKNFLALSVDEHTPTRHQGTKEERMSAILEPRYESLSIWHYRGGNCQILEDELVLAQPPHDDVKDALASAIEVCVAPTASRQRENGLGFKKVVSHPRFGGVSG